MQTHGENVEKRKKAQEKRDERVASGLGPEATRHTSYTGRPADDPEDMLTPADREAQVRPASDGRRCSC